MFWLSHKNGPSRGLWLLVSLHKYQRRYLICILQLDIIGLFWDSSMQGGFNSGDSGGVRPINFLEQVLIFHNFSNFFPGHFQTLADVEPLISLSADSEFSLPELLSVGLNFRCP